MRLCCLNCLAISYFIRTAIIAVAALITDAILDINAINQSLFPIIEFSAADTRFWSSKSETLLNLFVYPLYNIITLNIYPEFYGTFF